MVLSVFYFTVQFVIPLGLYHTITVEKVIDINVPKADCTGGKGACPPEDCGGPQGYNHLKQILVTPKHPEYESMKEWTG